MCNKTNFHAKSFKNGLKSYEFKGLFALTRHILIIASPFSCAIGIVSNLIVVSTIMYDPNRKTLKEHQYTYMAINAVINSLVLVIYSTNLLSECEMYGFFCSSVRTNKFTQFWRVIIGEYVASFLRLMSNLTYVAFSVNRLSLIGKNHGSFVSYVSEMSVGGFLRRVFAPCLVFSSIRIFKFFPNPMQLDESYPYPIIHFFDRLHPRLVLAYLSLEFIFSFVSNLLFLIVNLAFDIVLVTKLRETIKEKQVRAKEMKIVTTKVQNE